MTRFFFLYRSHFAGRKTGSGGAGEGMNLVKITAAVSSLVGGLLVVLLSK